MVSIQNRIQFTPVFNYSFNLNTFLVSLNQSGTYYFRVRARNRAGEEYSDMGAIAIIVLIEPSNGGNGVEPGIPGYNVFILIGIIFLGIAFRKLRFRHFKD